MGVNWHKYHNSTIANMKKKHNYSEKAVLSFHSKEGPLTNTHPINKSLSKEDKIDTMIRLEEILQSMRYNRHNVDTGFEQFMSILYSPNWRLWNKKVGLTVLAEGSF